MVNPHYYIFNGSTYYPVSLDDYIHEGDIYEDSFFGLTKTNNAGMLVKDSLVWTDYKKYYYRKSNLTPKGNRL